MRRGRRRLAYVRSPPRGNFLGGPGVSRRRLSKLIPGASAEAARAHSGAWHVISYSRVAAYFHEREGKVIPTLPEQVINAMAQRQHRFHHYIWHRVRNSWSRLGESERRAIRDINPGWVAPRAALDAAGLPLRDNDSGEDFLFMHRQMLALVNDILARVNSPDYPRVEGWARVPSPGDTDYPVPEFPDSGLEEIKSDDYFYQTILPLEQRYTDPDYLRSVTLGQLGSDIEFTLHNDMHMRWAAPSSVGYRPPTAITQTISSQWDSPAYDYLGDTYSSHINPVFWKLHGWVDDRIEAWKSAHTITGELEWHGMWVGPAAHRHGHFHETISAANPGDFKAHDELLEIDQIISATAAGELDGFFRPARRGR
jgi:hypothetical protein